MGFRPQTQNRAFVARFWACRVKRHCKAILGGGGCGLVTRRWCVCQHEAWSGVAYLATWHPVAAIPFLTYPPTPTPPWNPPLPGTTLPEASGCRSFAVGLVLADVIEHLWLAAFGGVSNSDHFRSQSQF